ncbi:MAG: helix-turn-helix transcriptional regulator [Hyphomicrobiales bacterium]|nr:helix-turn-helix transcriptional regulator [Hyphomicrobiales bacterium]
MTQGVAPSDQLLDLIYDAATDHELWSSAIVEIADMTGSVGGFVGGMDTTVPRAIFTFNGGLLEEAHVVYREHYLRNPLSLFMSTVPAGRLVRSEEILPLEQLKKTAFFDEVLRPQDVAHFAMVPLAVKQSFQVGLTLCHSERQGPYQSEELRLIARLFPHMRRSLLLGFRLDGYKALQRAEFSVLDRLSAGIVLLDTVARMTFANAAARNIIAEGGPLRLRNSVLVTATPRYSQQLAALIEAAARGTPVGTMSIPHPDDGRLFTISAVSVRRRDIDRFCDLGMRNVTTMLVIQDPARPMQVQDEWLIDAYGLTQAEARVALCTASGTTVAEAAHRLGVTPNTIKTHLRKVFAKTDTTRQAELVRLMASMAVLKGGDNSERDH